VLDTPKPPLAVTADKAYDSEKVRQQIKDDGALPIIPSRSNATRKAYCPKRFYRRRHKIENYLPHQRLAAHRHALRQARPELPCRHGPRRGTLLDQVVSPDPSHDRGSNFTAETLRLKRYF
jgi:hypothetical protein